MSLLRLRPSECIGFSVSRGPDRRVHSSHPVRGVNIPRRNTAKPPFVAQVRCFPSRSSHFAVSRSTKTLPPSTQEQGARATQKDPVRSLVEALLAIDRSGIFHHSGRDRRWKDSSSISLVRKGTCLIPTELRLPTWRRRNGTLVKPSRRSLSRTLKPRRHQAFTTSTYATVIAACLLASILQKRSLNQWRSHTYRPSAIPGTSARLFTPSRSNRYFQ